MRPDVKLGIISSMIVVLVAGGYYFYRDGGDTAIPVSSDTIATGKKVAPNKRVANKTTRPISGDKRSTSNRRRPSTTTGTATKSNRPASNTRVKNPTARQRMAHKDTRRKPLAGKRGAGKVTVPGRKSVARPSKPITSKSKAVAAKKTSTANRVASNPSSKKNRRSTSAGETLNRRTTSVPSGGPSHDAVERHRVQPGDTMASLAVNYYGDEKYTKFLINSNPQLTNPTRLRVGTTVLIPSRPADRTLLAATHQPKSPTPKKRTPTVKKPSTRSYTVKSGDSFYSIARDVLGDASQWQKLFELNKAVVKGDARKLQIGQVIQLPAS